MNFSRLFVAAVLTLTTACTSFSPSRKVASSPHLTTQGHVCPVPGAEQATIDDAYSAMAIGSDWSTFLSFVERGDPEYFTYEYDETTEANSNTQKGIFLLYPELGEDAKCARQIHLTKPVVKGELNPEGNTNIWEGYVYIELCLTAGKFTPKAGVLEYAGPGRKRTRQVLNQFWYTIDDNKCTMHVRVNPLDFKEGRTIGVSQAYEFTRTK